jgi:hypothetical protein
MAQHDYNLINQSGASFRADLNNALAAIATNNSGTSEPSTAFAYEWWIDTSTGLLKIRNSANSAWITTGLNLTQSNTFNGNATTATTLQTARTINGVSFNGSANISFNTDSVSEGSSNLYFTNERVDDRVDDLLVAGTGISLTYDDGSNTLTIANTNDADITGVIAGNGLTGGGTSGNVTLNVDVDDSSIEIGSGALRVKNSGITNTMLAGSISNAKLSNSSVTINSQSLALGGSLDLDTSEIPESGNLYYTSARANTDFDTRLATKDTDNLAEGDNLYYTQSRFDTAFGNKTTANLTENTNLYYTTARANTAIDSRVVKSFVDGLSVAATTAVTLLNSRDISLSGDVVGSVSFNGSSNVDIVTTIQANSVALGNDTTGNYIQTITGTANKITVSGSGSETADVTLSLPDDVQIADSLTVAGNLTVNGTLTSLDTTNLDIEDNLFQLNAGLTGSPVNDSGMLINRGNQNNGIIMWDESVDKFTMGLTTADGSATGNITLSSLGTLVANLEGSVTGNITGQVSDISNFTTANLTENTNLYYTTARSNADFDTRLATKNTGSLSEGSNLYYTDARVQAVSINNVVEDTTPQLGGDLDLNSNDITGTGDINITGTATMDGLTVTGNPVITNLSPQLFFQTGNGNNNFQIAAQESVNNAFEISSGGTGTNAPSDTYTKRLVVQNSGDISFYEDTGSTAKFFWDASAESLGIGTTSPTVALQVAGQIKNNNGYLIDNGTNAGFLTVDGSNVNFGSSTAGKGLKFFTAASSNAMTIDSSGNVGVGVTSPSSFNAAGTGIATVSGTGTGASTLALYSGTTSSGFLYFSDGTTGADRYQGYVEYSHSGNNMRIGTAGSERMRIDSSGIVYIGSGTAINDTNVKLQLNAPSGGEAGLGINDNGAYALLLQYTSGTGARIRNIKSTPMLFENNGSERMRIDSSGRVGIGTISPSAPLTVSGADGTLAVFTNASNADFLFKTVSGVSLITPSTGTLAFGTSSTERMRIDSSGNLLVGNTVVNPASGFASQKGFGYAASTGKVEIATDANAAVMELGKNNANDGSILVFRKQGNVVGTINNSGTNLGIEGQSGLVFLGGDRTGSVRAINSHGSGQPRLDANNDNTTDLGTGGNRFKDLYLSGGVHLGGTGSANKLDDYEEGTWSPTIASGTVGFSAALYTKVGRLVMCQFIFDTFSDRSSGNAVVVGNLPFAAEATNRPVTIGCLGSFTSSSFGSVSGGYLDSTTTLRLYNTSAGAFRFLKHSDLTSTSTTYYVAFTYTAA